MQGIHEKFNEKNIFLKKMDIFLDNLQMIEKLNFFIDCEFSFSAIKTKF